MTWEKVSTEELEDFVASFEGPLDVHVSNMCEPPVKSYNDFSGGKKWPDSVVAKVVLNTAMQGHPAYKGEPDEFYLWTTEP